MEEPTSPDDILGHARICKAVSPVRLATGEHCHKRVMFKQLMQAEAIDVCQIDSCRLAGVNENLAVLLMAAKFNIPVCPHAGGIGLCECVQHLAIFDYLRVSTSLEGRVTEFVDHLHNTSLIPSEYATDIIFCLNNRVTAPKYVRKHSQHTATQTARSGGNRICVSGQLGAEFSNGITNPDRRF